MKNEVSVIIDNNPNLGYEKKGWMYFLMVPVMFILTFWVALKKKILGPKLKINTFWFDGISPICREVKENATTWKALDIIYNYRPGQEKNLKGRVTDFWNEINNIKAVRNRLRLVKSVLKKRIQELSESEKEIRLVSIASGAAQEIVEIMKEFKQKDVFIHAIFLDRDSTAIAYSKNLAKQAGILNQITFANTSTKELKRIAAEFKPHIVEVIGLLEYRPHKQAINLLERIYNILNPNGIVITSNISPNPERLFSYWVGNWSMVYRTIEQLSEVVTKAGFKPQKCKIIQEPLKIHNVVVCRKN